MKSGTCKRIQPQDILEDIPDEIIDTDLSCIKDFFTMAAWEKLKDTGEYLTAISKTLNCCIYAFILT